MGIDDILNKIPRRKIPTEMDRICNIPTNEFKNPERITMKWTKRLATGSYSLRIEQGLALETIHLFGGGYFNYSVGIGKSLICILAGQAAGAKNPVILVPPALVKQMKDAIEDWSEHFRFVKPDVLSYNKISTQPYLLADKKYDLIAADEAHYLRHKSSARTSRVLKYFIKNPSTRFVALSGTMTTKSLMEYSHILELALREYCPVPLDIHELHRWAACIDAKGEPSNADRRMMYQLVQWAKLGDFATTDTSTIRKAFQKRLRLTPGVAITRKGSCGSSLYMKKHRIMHSRHTKAALKKLNEEWCLPNDIPLADASIHSIARKRLSLGFYYVWDWSSTKDDEEYTKEQKISRWQDVRLELNRSIAAILRYHKREGIDSPALVIEWSKRGGGNQHLRNLIHEWEEIKHTCKPKTKAVWVCEKKMDYVIRWAKKQKQPTILWYTSHAVQDKLEQAGIKCFGANSEIPNGHLCAASIPVHGKGRNLQSYSNCFIIETPSNGGTMEQLLGRTHRSGQQADAVWWHYFDFGRAIRTAKNDAKYIEESQGSIQKLNIATYLQSGVHPC